MLPVVLLFVTFSLAYANDAFRDAPQAAPQNAAVERDLQAKKQADLKFEHDNRQQEVEDARKRAVEEQRALLEKQKLEKERRVQEARLARQKEHQEDTQERKLKERHDFLLAQAKADQQEFLRVHPPKNVQPKPNTN